MEVARSVRWNFLLRQIEIVFHRLSRSRGECRRYRDCALGRIRPSFRSLAISFARRHRYPSSLDLFRPSSLTPPSKLSPSFNRVVDGRVISLKGAFAPSRKRPTMSARAHASDLDYRHVHQSLRNHIARRTPFHFRSFPKCLFFSRENILRGIRTAFGY